MIANWNSTLNVVSKNLAAPIYTLAAYTGIAQKTNNPLKYCMNLLLNLFDKNSGNVIAFRYFPIALVGFPKNMNARNIPTAIFKNTSHRIPIPFVPASPPNPTIAAVLINVAP